MAYSTASCVAITIVGLVASWIFASLRFYVRMGILKRLNWDDFFAALALFCYTIQGIFYLIGNIDHGLGKHATENTSPETMSQGLKDLFVSELAFLLGTAFIKISFALTLFRIVIDRIHIYTLYVAIFCTTVISVVTFLFVILTCKPVSFFWENVINPFSGGTCLGEEIQIRISYAHIGVMLFMDIVLGIVLPVHVLSGLKMQRRVKISAMLLLSLGSSAAIATIARLVYSSRDTVTDFLFSVNVPFLWAGIELASSIIGTSAATLKPLLVALKIFKGPGSGSGSGSGSDKRGNQYQLNHNKISWPKGRTNIVIIAPDKSETSSTEEITWDDRSEV